jgi:hypothetical protein
MGIPTQRNRTFAQFVLPGQALGVVLNLSQGGLPDIDISIPPRCTAPILVGTPTVASAITALPTIASIVDQDAAGDQPGQQGQDLLPGGLWQSPPPLDRLGRHTVEQIEVGQSGLNRSSGYSQDAQIGSPSQVVSAIRAGANLFAISGSSGDLQPRPQAANQMVQRAQTAHIHDRDDRFDRVHAPHVRGIGPDRSRAAIGQLHDEEHHPVDTSEITSSEQLPEQRMSRRCYPHLARQRRPNVLQSVAITAGTGKSHLLIGLGLAACEQGRRVRYATTAKLVNELVEAADDRVLSRVVARYGRLDLLLLDELGYVNIDPRGAELLFQIITDREERASIAIGTNLPFSEWGSVFPDPRLVAAIVDRVTFNAHIIETGTQSYRLRTSKTTAHRKRAS